MGGGAGIGGAGNLIGYCLVGGAVGVASPSSGSPPRVPGLSAIRRRRRKASLWASNNSSAEITLCCISIFGFAESLSSLCAEFARRRYATGVV